jgi:hypothetical protein
MPPRRLTRQSLQSCRQFGADIGFGLLGHDAAEKGLAIKAADHPFDIEFEMLRQLAAFRPGERRGGKQRLLRKFVFEKFDNGLRLRQAALRGLDKGNPPQWR